jgi:thioester reductase-like protein
VPGFLGSFLLCEFLRLTRSYVYCLVRVAAVGGGGDATPAQACRDRVIKTLQSYGLYTEDIEAALSERMGILVGDAGLQNMGLDDDEYHFLTQHVDTVVHAAAIVNLMYPYDALVAGNVRGTSNVVSFCQSGKIKAIHYVSSDAVFPLAGDGTPRLESDTLDDGWKALHSGYAQSKWVAEQLVRRALDSGLPGALYRCGNIGGHMTSGAWNSKDSNLTIIRACLLAQAVPVVEGLSLTIEATPVDFVSKFVVSCAENIRGSTNKTFHLIQPHHLRMEDLLEAAKRVGHANIKAVGSVKEWVNLVEVASASAGLQPVTEEVLLEICNLEKRVFSNDNVAAWLTKLRQTGLSDGQGMFLPPR